MKVWVDNSRAAPSGYIWKANVPDAKALIEYCEEVYVSASNNFTDPYREQIMRCYKITIIDVEKDGGFDSLLKWLENTKRNYEVRFH